MSREQALRFVERMESSWRRGVGKWLAYEESTGAFVGRGGPSWAVVDGAECVEIGWALRQEVWGRGYATEIGRAGLDTPSRSQASRRSSPTPRSTTCVRGR